MARPKKQNVDLFGSEPVEVVTERVEPVTEIVTPKQVEDVVPELTVEVVRPKQVEKAQAPAHKAICDIDELTDEDKQILIEKKIKTIISQTQIPFIPALVKYKEPGSTAIPPMYALVDYDHRFVGEAWDFYRTNVRDPYVKDFLLLIGNVMGKPNKVFPRLVLFNYE